MIRRKILICGLPGSGKTTLADALAVLLHAVHWNANAVREQFRHHTFSPDDRIIQAKRMGWLCDRSLEACDYAIADFVCPTEAARAAFQARGKAFVIFMADPGSGLYQDTNQMFVPPEDADVVVRRGNVGRQADTIYQMLRGGFDNHKPCAMFVGRFQPFHDGHRALIEEGIRRVGQAMIVIRDTHYSDPANNPWPQQDVVRTIEREMVMHRDRIRVMCAPNITAIYYGRKVGYAVERIDLDEQTEAISASAIRAAR